MINTLSYLKNIAGQEGSRMQYIKHGKHYISSFDKYTSSGHCHIFRKRGAKLLQVRISTRKARK